ncbi:hypothetical protein N9L24_02865 [Candidatus Marinamargulisbacteria bacterium]|jgi:hypothetical protein|nr:hypothetical protein [Candidatus Marinamargulisbacteria bacterium]
MQNIVRIGQNTVGGGSSPRGAEASQRSVENQENKKKLLTLISQFGENFNIDEAKQDFLNRIVDIVVTAETMQQNTVASAAYKQSMIIMKAILEGQEDGTTAQSAPTAESSLPSQLLANLLQFHIDKDFSGLSNSEESKQMALDFFMIVLALPDLIKNESQSNQGQCTQLRCNNKHCNKDSVLREELTQKLRERINEEVFSQIEPLYNKGLPQILSDNVVPPPPAPHPDPRPSRPKPILNEQPEKGCCTVS